MAALLGAAAAAGIDPHTLATWLVTGQDELEGRAPASLLGEPVNADALRTAAERTAA